MLDRLPVDVVRAHMAPHLTDADVVNWALAFRADNPVADELVARAEAFRAAAAELESFARVVTAVLTQRSAEAAEQLLRTMPLAANQVFTHSVFKRWELSNGGRLRARLWMYADGTHGWSAAISDLDESMSVHVFRAAGARMAIPPGAKCTMSRALVEAVERGMGVRRSARLSGRVRPSYVEPSDDL